MTGSLEIIPLDGLPLLRPGDDLGRLIVERAEKIGAGIMSFDVIAVGQKAVSKSEGRVVDINAVKPSKRAAELAKRTGKRAEFVEIVLRDSKRVLRADKDAFIVTPKHGSTCLNGGVDKSNVQGDDKFALLPRDPDASARKLRSRISRLTGKKIGVIICDTRSRPFRRGQVEEMIGIAGLNPIVDYRGLKDLFGYQLRFKNVSIADELASAAELVMGQGREATPAAIIRGLKRIRFQDRASSRNIAISASEDLFQGTL